ncbi:MAG: hypothetical protein ACXWQJ_16145, partial [Bdellovibrionota bacterium]
MFRLLLILLAILLPFQAVANSVCEPSFAAIARGNQARARMRSQQARALVIDQGESEYFTKVSQARQRYRGYS